jgi:ribosomal protein L29
MIRKIENYKNNCSLIFDPIDNIIIFLESKLIELKFKKHSIKFKNFNLLIKLKKNIAKLKLEKSNIKNYSRIYDTSSK